MYLGVYNLHKSKMHDDDNNLMAERIEMEARNLEFSILHAKLYVSLEVKDVYYKLQSNQ